MRSFYFLDKSAIFEKDTKSKKMLDAGGDRTDDDQPMVKVGDVSDCPTIPPIQYEHLDHTADIQLHAWGDTLEVARSCSRLNSL